MSTATSTAPSDAPIAGSTGLSSASPSPPLANDLFLRAARGEKVERPPVWMMRQAGRYLPEYREVRAPIDFLTLCKTPELAAKVTIQPVDRLGVDAAILFADILLPLEAMGAELRFEKGDGPVFPSPIRRRDQIAGLSRPDVAGTLGYVFEALRTVRRELAGRVPVLGFGGTPWTLASYLVEGGTSKQFAHLLGWSWEDPDGLKLLLDRLAEVSIDYLLGQVDAGAQAVQLFDSWGGLLDLERWRRISRPSIVAIAEALAGKVPVIFYVQGGSHLLPGLAELPVEILSVDWRTPLSEARRIVGPDKVLQGNLDPAALLAPVDEIERRTRAMLADAAGGPHIANLGHGIFPTTPVEHALAFVETVQGRRG